MTGIRERGPDVSIDELAAFVGVSKPVLYDEFGDKNGLAEAVSDDLAERLERTITTRLAASGSIDAPIVVRLIVAGLVDIVSDETEVYRFLVRSVRQSDRGFLDNALVRQFHQRASLVVTLSARSMEPALLPVLTDGLFGFMFAAIESWQTRRQPAREDLIDQLAAVVLAGLHAVSDSVPGFGSTGG